MRKLITILFVIIGQVSFGQVYQIMPQYGYSAPRFNTDSTLQLPTFNGVPTLKSNKTNKGAIAIDSTNGRFYFYNPKTSAWSQVTGGSSVDTTSLSNRINLKIDSLKRFNDTVYSYKNGSRAFAFKDSVGTNPAPVGYYGAFQDTTSQTAASINTAYPVKFNTTDLTNGVSVVNDGNSNPTRITLANTGIYNIQFSLQLEKTGGSGNMIADIWIRKNGVDIPSTTGKVVLTGSANASPVIASWNYVLNLVAGDYVQLMWATSNTNVEIVAAAATAPHPAIPSAILTVTQQSGIMAGTGIQAADTTAMLIPYMKKNDSTIYYSKYRSDTSRTNIYSGINTKLAKSDTSTISARIDLKLNISDTSNMLSKYLRKTDTATLSNRINLKLNIADTSTMLNPYLRKSDTSTLSTRIDSKLAITDTSVFQRKSLASYTFQANNTTATANATAQVFKDTSGTYTGTPTWSGGTAPTTLTNAVFSYTQIGKVVTLRITMIYTNQGSSNTRIAIPLMATMPTPAAPSGYTSTSDIFGFGAGYFGNVINSIVASTTGSSVCYIKGTATGYEVIVDRGTSGSGKYVWATISYFTN